MYGTRNFHHMPTCFQIVLVFISVALVESNTCISMTDFDTSIAASNYKVRENSKLVKWAIIALTRPGRSDIETRNSALAKRIKPFANKHNITIIFFSESYFSPKEVNAWRKTFLNIAAVKLVNTAHLGFTLPERFGYKYMCKFFALDLYDLIQEYDYYMRCDSDCYIKTLNYDIFEYTEIHNIEYGFAMRKLEAHGPTKQTLPVWVMKYARNCGLEPTAKMDEPLSVCFNFYNNWHIGSVRFFRRPDVQHFLQSVNNSGHILHTRWGDSTIQAYAVRLFMDPKHIRQLPDFEYVHGSHSNRLISSVGDGSKTNVPQRLSNWNYIH